MKSWAAVALVSLAVAGLAGCLQGGSDRPNYAAVQLAVDAEAAKVLHVDHLAVQGHSDASLHQGSANMELVGYSNGVDDTGDPNKIPARGVYNELAVTPTHVYLSSQSADGSYGGFSILDTTNPFRPHVLSHFVAQGGADIEVNADESLAFLASQRNSPEQVVGGAAAGGPTAGAPRGIYVVDISDKKAPQLDSFTPLPANGPHTITYYRHTNGNEYLLACTYDLVTDPGTGAILSAAPASQRLIVFLIARNPLVDQGLPGPRVSLVPVAQFQIAEPAPAGKLYFPHDASVQVHAPTGKTLITLAYWDKGVRILDFTNPPAPQADPTQSPPMLRELGAFTEFSPSAFNNIHLAKAFDAPLDVAASDGQVHQAHVTVAEPEIISATEETGQITLLDTTDPTHPSALGHWTLPPQVPSLGVSNLDFSPHNFDTFGGKIALAHNHAGVWVIDASTPENVEHPVEVGFYMTAKERKASPQLQPRTWGVFEQGGLLYASDEATGLYILRYTGP